MTLKKSVPADWTTRRPPGRPAGAGPCAGRPPPTGPGGAPPAVKSTEPTKKVTRVGRRRRPGRGSRGTGRRGSRPNRPRTPAPSTVRGHVPDSVRRPACHSPGGRRPGSPGTGDAASSLPGAEDPPRLVRAARALARTRGKDVPHGRVEEPPAGRGPTRRSPASPGAGWSRSRKNRLPDQPMLPQTAYQIVLDEVMLDGNARFNLATFVTTWMDEEADRLYAATVRQEHDRQGRVPADRRDRGPLRADARRPVARAARRRRASGTSTTGSSEGCMLAGLALKRRWQQARRAAGLPTDRPNIVMGGNVQVVWEKFANYWEVEPRYVPLEGDVFHLTADRLLDHVDENTIGVVAVLGSTMDGSYEPVQEICAALDDYEAGHRRLRARARRRRVGRLRRAVHPAGPGLGLPARAGRLDPGLRPQVRPGLPGRRLGAVAGRRAPARRTWSST